MRNVPFFFDFRRSRACGSYSGAMTASRTSFFIAFAVGEIDGTVQSDDPAVRGDRVRRVRERIGLGERRRQATPDGLVCLITTAAGRSNSVARRSAASRSIRLLYDSSFPCNFSAVAVAANGNGSRYRAAF